MYQHHTAVAAKAQKQGLVYFYNTPYTINCTYDYTRIYLGFYSLCALRYLGCSFVLHQKVKVSL